MMELEDKINYVKNILKDKKVAIAFSGGADSTLLTYLSSKSAKDTLALTVNNHLFPEGFVENTKETAESLKVRHEIIDINFYENEDIMLNDSKRCFNCRKIMYTNIKETALKKGFDYICDGNNITDLVDDRPGILISYKKDFKTPFIKAKLTSKEIHEYLCKNNINYSKSTTCLLTRIPTNTKATFEKINRIKKCEDYILNNTKCEIAKVRELNGIGICEVDNIYEILKDDQFKQINDELKRQGYEKVALNLSQIEENEYLKLDYNNNSFSYQLPFTINIKNTKKQIENILSYDNDKIEIEKMIIYESGLIKGHDFKNYEDALDNFMEIISKIRRNV